MEKKFSPLLTVTFIAFLGLAVALSEKVRTNIKERFLIPPPEYIEYFHFGFNESMADSFWIRWIQDLDVCMTYTHKPIATNEKAPTDKEEARYYAPRHKICDNSWAFKMLDTVTRLAPRYQMAYVGGAVTLSVIVEDYDGASVIFERGLLAYPKDWSLLYRAAYHFLYDRKDPARAAVLLEQAGDNGAPLWVKSLASRLYSRSGKAELGLAVLLNYRKQIEGNEEAEKDVDKRIAELKKALKGP